MKVTVKLAANLRKAAQTGEIALDAKTVKDVLSQLKIQFGENQDFLNTLKLCHLIVNSTNIMYLKGVGTKLADGDVVTLVPPIGGG